MEMSEFLEPREPVVEMPAEESENSEQESIDVQKAVVEALAADKAEQDERIIELQKQNQELQNQVAEFRRDNENLKVLIKNIKAELEKTGDILTANNETVLSNKVALIDRGIEIGDNFTGETREHVLEVLKDAWHQCEADGRLRRAQLLESVVMANESTGILEEKRNVLKKLFTDNSNLISGPVINELDNMGIKYKNGEEYLLPAEILKREY